MFKGMVTNDIFKVIQIMKKKSVSHYKPNIKRLINFSNYFNNSETPIICYKYNKPIRSTIFNFNKIVNDLDIDSNTPESCDCQNSIIYIPLQVMLLQVIFMSFLTLEFAILFLKVLNIDFPLILISLNVVERSLLLQMT